ncbi:MAG: MarR family transcriptional regulator [Bacteroidales bacterium]|jgi:DNA-binding transcriptional regulator YhcF (GntR family)|nr:MarR family transcriptional regulator [Bacteroidales bacterium]
MNELSKYLFDTLGVEISIIPLEKRLLQNLPLYITTTYKFYEANIYGQRICLLTPTDTENHKTPDVLAKQITLITEKIGFPAVFVFDKIVSYNLKRFIRKRINFIMPNKQLFIPVLMMDLKKAPATISQKAVLLAPIAQLILLYHLQKELLNGLTTKQLSEKVGKTYRTTNRAAKNLEKLGLVQLVGGKEKHIIFSGKGKSLWNTAQDFLQHPIDRIVYTDDLTNLTQSNINALAHYTMLNDEPKQYYAIDTKEFNKLKMETDKQFGEHQIEIWRYNPILLSNNGFVDKLSLFLILKNNVDERVQIELEQMIYDIKWLEE